jgi:four helix bundle protein
MHELNVEVWKSTRHLTIRDEGFCKQIRDAADSAERNVAEGFGRYHPGSFANFLDFSRASALETKGHLKKARKVGYLTPETFLKLDDLATRGVQAVAKLQRYLRTQEAKRNAARRYRR